jgi:hypothetical protein
MNTLPLTNQPPSDLIIPLEVIRSLASRYKEAGYAPEAALEYVAYDCAKWGADKELDACCEWLSWSHSRHVSDKLRYTRRPKLPSLKEQALEILNDCSVRLPGAHENIIRRALEQLND